MKPSKRNERPDVKQVIGANVKALIAARLGSFDAACKLLAIKPTQLKRILAGRHAVTMTTVERIAIAFEIEPYQLLIPGMNPDNPQVLRSLSPAEERLYRALEDVRRAS